MKENPNQSFHFTQPQPASEPVDLRLLLDEIATVIRAHVVLSAHAATALALWIVHTYVFDARDAVAYVSIESPEKRCGKTTLLSVLAGLACRALVASNITVSALFRVIDEAGPTLLIDEADTFLGGNSAMRGILNCGNTWRTAYVLRLSGRKIPNPQPDTVPATEGSDGTKKEEALDSSLVRYSCWCPKVIAMIGSVPDTIADRSVVIRLGRKLVSEKCAPLTDFKPEALTAKCARFAVDNRERIGQAALETVPGLNDRAADTFEPLFVLARMAGQEWFDRAAEAAVSLAASQNSDAQGGGLLLDILAVFVNANIDKIFSRTLVNTLKGGTHWVPCAFFEGRRLDTMVLAQTLRPYGISPSTIRIGAEVSKGYRATDFRDALNHYVPRTDIDARMKAIHDETTLRAEAKAEREAENNKLRAEGTFVAG